MESEPSTDADGNANAAGERKVKIDAVREKPRRGATWTEHEVSELFRIWKKPEVSGFLSAENPLQRRGSGTDLARKIAQELASVGISRTSAEVRAKVKNLKGEYRKAKDGGCPDGYRYFSQMRSIMDPQDSSERVLFQSNVGIPMQDLQNCITVLPHFSSSQVSFSENPVRIELELFDNINVGFQGDELSIPIEIDGGNIILPDRVLSSDETISSNIPSVENDTSSNSSNLFTNAVVVDNSEMQQLRVPLTISGGECTNENDLRLPADSGQRTPVIVITTTDVGQALSASESSIHPNNQEAGQSSGMKRKPALFGGPSKRRKTQNDIQEFLSKIMASTTEQLVAEIKASEQRFMEWEERKRKEDRIKEEKMLQTLLQPATNSANASSISVTLTSDCEKTSERADSKQENESADLHLTDLQKNETKDEADLNEEQRDCLKKLKSASERIKDNFDKQFKDIERDLLEWEKKMDMEEAQHTEKLLSMLTSSVQSNFINRGT